MSTARDGLGPIPIHARASSEWTFSGEQNDPNGLVYLRARYYDPSTGQFVTEGPFPGSAMMPLTVNQAFASYEAYRGYC